jgi:Zn-dependent protease
MDPALINGLLLYGVLVFSLVVHEAAHALAAYWGGDTTAYLGGQVTLNPVPHMRREPFGTIMLPLALLYLSKGTATMGFAHAPVDPSWAYYNPRKAALMSAAGPISNFLLALIAVLVLHIMMSAGEIVAVDNAAQFQFRFAPADFGQEGLVRATCRICGTFIFLNILLGVLNLLPIPPLDGAGVIGGIFPRSIGRFYDHLRTQPMIGLLSMGLIFYLFYNYGYQYLLIPGFDLAADLVKP